MFISTFPPEGGYLNITSNCFVKSTYQTNRSWRQRGMGHQVPPQKTSKQYHATT